MTDPQEIAKKYPPAFESVLPDCVCALSYSHDGRWLCATSLNGLTRIFESHTGECRAEFQEPSCEAFWAALHPTKNLLAIGYDHHKVVIYSLDPFEKLHELPHQSAWVENGQWSGNGAFLATSAGKIMTLWKEGKEKFFETPDHGSTITSLDWHPLKEQIAVASYGGVSIWEPADLKSITPLAYKGSLLKVLWSPDGQWIVSGNQDASLHIWPIKEKTQDMHMSGYAVKVQYLSWNHSGQYMACSNLNVVSIWDFSGNGPAGTSPEMFESLTGEVTALSYHPFEPLLIAVGTSEGQIELYSHAINNFVGLRALPLDSVNTLAWNAKGTQIAAGGQNGSLRVWKINLKI